MALRSVKKIFYSEDVSVAFLLLPDGGVRGICSMNIVQEYPEFLGFHETINGALHLAFTFEVKNDDHLDVFAFYGMIHRNNPYALVLEWCGTMAHGKTLNGKSTLLSDPQNSSVKIRNAINCGMLRSISLN